MAVFIFYEDNIFSPKDFLFLYFEGKTIFTFWHNRSIIPATFLYEPTNFLPICTKRLLLISQQCLLTIKNPNIDFKNHQECFEIRIDES